MALTNDFVISCDALIKDTPALYNTLLASKEAGSVDYPMIISKDIATTSMQYMKQVGGVQNIVTIAGAVDGTLRSYDFRSSTTQGLDGWLDGVKGTNDPNTDSGLGSDILFIGQHHANNYQLNGTIGNITFKQGDLDNDEVTG